MTRLSVNVNKVATLRNTRPLDIPGVVHLSRIALEAGAHGITVHPRPDQRHIRPGDVTDLAQLLSHYPHAEYNIEGNPFHGYMELIRLVRPAQCTLVPDEPDAPTSNQGWNLPRDGDRLKPVIDELHELGCRVSLFMDPQPDRMAAAAQLGADRVELYTEPYASAFARQQRDAVDAYARAGQAAREAGLAINAGHDLNLQNLPHFLRSVPDVAEVSIGHALIADALEWGMAATVTKYLSVCAS